MKQYIVRLLNYEFETLCGDVVTANNEGEALVIYINTHPTEHADKCVYDKYVVEEVLVQ